MPDNDAADQVVANPTYMADIRFFFRPIDIDHMGGMGIDLSTYAGVKRNALAINTHTGPPSPTMPPSSAGGRWSSARVQTFKNWIINGCPQGTAAPTTMEPTTPTSGDRLRKNVESLGDAELEKLKTAFQGLMDRDGDASATNSYFYIAGQHGLPFAWCMHHEDGYNPWHRTYLKVFEDALRSVEGCEDVTLPYWDIRKPLPEVLQQPPFASYDLPRDPGAQATPVVTGFFPYTTQRNDPGTIQELMKDGAPTGFGVYADIDLSLKQSTWGASDLNGYQDWSIQAHDGGHGSIGPTMGNQRVASYDPVFWFYHCNLDRLWLSWQTIVGATTLTGFKSTLDHGSDWLSPPFNALPPFSPPEFTPATTTGQTIEFGITYDALETVSEEVRALENTAGSLAATRSFSIKRATPVSVRVKGIDRLAIPGTFAVNLLADGAPIARRAFFQPDEPRDCEGCRKHALVNIDFRIDANELVDRTLSVGIEVLYADDDVKNFPLAQAGNPTINARLLLHDE